MHKLNFNSTLCRVVVDILVGGDHGSMGHEERETGLAKC
jgi:hypothetical protein